MMDNFLKKQKQETQTGVFLFFSGTGFPNIPKNILNNERKYRKEEK